MLTNESDFERFQRFVADQVAHGAELTPEDCLELWRAEHPSARELAESVAAIGEALDQIRAEKGFRWRNSSARFAPRRGSRMANDEFSRNRRAKSQTGYQFAFRFLRRIRGFPSARIELLGQVFRGFSEQEGRFSRRWISASNQIHGKWVPDGVMRFHYFAEKR